MVSKQALTCCLCSLASELQHQEPDSVESLYPVYAPNDAPRLVLISVHTCAVSITAAHSPTCCCNSQGIECHFLEAWHQKLHTNTTPEDITVCEAYIAFLESGDIGNYSRVLWENGGISRADMANKWDRKIPGMQNPAWEVCCQ